MFAIIEDGSRQYRVAPGEKLSVDYRKDAEEGGTITFDRVLLANGGGASTIGSPLIAGATVTAEVLYALDKGQKLEIQKIRRRKNSRRHTGHRQKYTTVQVRTVDVPGLVEAAPEPAPAAPVEA